MQKMHMVLAANSGLSNCVNMQVHYCSYSVVGFQVLAHAVLCSFLLLWATLALLRRPTALLPRLLPPVTLQQLDNLLNICTLQWLTAQLHREHLMEFSKGTIEILQSRVAF